MMLRMFVQVAYGVHGDTPHAYLSALRRVDIPLRALPIGAAAALSNEKRWYDVSSSFTQPMAIPFVNIVCAPMGLPMGTRTPIAAMATQDDLPPDMPPELRAQLARATRKASSSPLVYEPKTVFGGLWTKGVKNVAIVEPCDSDVPSEYPALELYDLVIVTTPSHPLRTWRHRDLRYVPPEPHDLAGVLGALCRSGSGGGVTTLSLRATPEPLATTSPRSTGSTTSSSRSRVSAKAVIPPKTATSTSTSTPSHGRTSLAGRMWKSFTRSLGLSKP